MANPIPSVVLCVDDDQRALLARSRLLSVAGYDVQTASCGDVALQILQHCRFDLVVADYFLPGLKGADLVKAIKQAQPQALVVLLTAAPEGPCAADTADLVLIKGMEPSRFLAAIERLLRTRQATGAGAGGGVSNG